MRSAQGGQEGPSNHVQGGDQGHVCGYCDALVNHKTKAINYIDANTVIEMKTSKKILQPLKMD